MTTPNGECLILKMTALTGRKVLNQIVTDGNYIIQYCTRLYKSRALYLFSLMSFMSLERPSWGEDYKVFIKRLFNLLHIFQLCCQDS